MKKLMTMIAAVATSFGLFAADPLPTDNSESFAEATPGTTITADTTTYWGWNGDADITTAEAVVEEAVGGNVLAIKTGSKTLSRKLIMAGSSYDVVSNVYFDTKIDLDGQVLEDFPTIPDDAKIAIFAYNNVEDVEQNPETALYAVAAAGEGEGKWLYKLTADMAQITNGQRRITVQAYKNILKDSENAGFKIFIDGGEVGDTTPAVTISAAYAIDETTGKVTDWTNLYDEDDYLKGLVLPQLNGVRGTLFLGLVPGVEGQALTAMDLIGNAKIANIEINEKGFDFIAPDAQLMSLVLNDVEIVDGTLDPAGAIDADGNILEDCSFTVASTDSTKSVIKFEGEGAVQVGNDFTVKMTPNATLTITSYALAANVFDADNQPVLAQDDYPFTDFEEAFTTAAGISGAKIELAKDQDVGLLMTSADLTIDLNGKTITGVGDVTSFLAAIYVGGGALTIVDSSLSQTGKVVGEGEGVAAVLVEDGAALDIAAGTFDGDVVMNDGAENAIAATAGSFKQSATMTKAAVEEFIDKTTHEVDGNVVTGYWTVVPAVPKIDYVNFTVTYDPEKVENVTVKTNGEDVVGVTGNYIVESNAVVTITADAADGFKNVTITGDNVTVTDGVFTADKAESIITISADPMVYATVPDITTVYTYNGVEQTAQLDNGEGYVVVGNSDKQTNAGVHKIEVALESGYDAWEDDSTENKFIDWTINKAVVNVTAEDVTIKVGDPKPTKFEAKVSPDPFGTDVIDYTVDCPTYEDKEGKYAIVVTPGTNPNYDVSGTPGTLKVEAAGPVLPDWAKDDPVVAEKYNTWAAGKTIDNPNAPEVKQAFLLNCALDATKIAAEEKYYAITAFTVGSLPTARAANSDGDEYNGVSKVYGAAAVEGPWSEQPIEAAGVYKFFKTKLMVK